MAFLKSYNVVISHSRMWFCFQRPVEKDRSKYVTFYFSNFLLDLFSLHAQLPVLHAVDCARSMRRSLSVLTHPVETPRWQKSGRTEGQRRTKSGGNPEHPKSSQNHICYSTVCIKLVVHASFNTSQKSSLYL